MIRAFLTWCGVWCLPLLVPAYGYIFFPIDGGLPVTGLHRVEGWLLTSIAGIVAVFDWYRLNVQSERRETRRLILFFHVIAAVITTTLTYVGIRLADLIVIWNAKPGGPALDVSSRLDIWWQAVQGISWWIIPAVAIAPVFHRLGSAMGKKSEEIK
jgi:hypothetical protein